MRVLVTGCRGMLGRRLMELLADDHELYGCDRLKADIGSNYIYEKIDLTDPKKLASFLKDICPEAIFHLAAKTQVDDCELNPEEAWLNNSYATQNLVKYSSYLKPVFFYVSTDYVFDGQKSSLYRTTDPLSPRSVYGRTKAEGESWVRRLNPKHFIVRTAWLYGPEGANFVDTIYRLGLEKKEVRVVNDQTGSPTFTRDLAGALVEMLGKQFILPKIPYGIYHYTGSGKISWFDFAKKIYSLAGLKTRVLPMTSLELARPAPRPERSALDLGPIERNFGVHPRDWEDSLRDYLREKGILHDHRRAA